ncbi:MAG TPA: hypothetical protein VFU19_14160 [Iamia sp.]|nr:hypothetical protein [Iamia sp.]
MVVGVLAVAAVAVFAVRAVTGGSGGASSPEAAVEDLAAAIEAADPIAVLDAMEPGEVEALGEVVETAADRAAELGFSPDDATLGGVDIGLTGTRYEVDELGDGIARVTVTAGSARVDVTRDALGELTAAVVDAASDDDEDARATVDAADLVTEGEDGEIEPFVVTVKRGGGWYVSPLHTAAQYLVDGLGLADPDLPAPDPGDGAEDPEAAVRDLLLAAGELDGDATADLVGGPAGDAVRAYRGPLEEWVGAAAEDATVEIDTLETEVAERAAGGRRVVVTELEGTVTWTDPDSGDERSSQVSWDGTCLDVRDSEEAEEEDEASVGSSDFCLTDGWARVGIEELAVVVVEEGGTWRVDPLATVGDVAAAIVPELTEGMVLRVLGFPEAAEPSAEISAGEPTTVTLDEAGTAVVSVAIGPDERFTVTAGSDDEDREVDAYLIDADGQYTSAYSIVEPTGGGEYTLVVYTDDWAPGEVMVAVSPVAEEAIGVGDTVDGELETGAEVVEYTVDLDADVTYLVTLDNDDLGLEVVDPDDFTLDLLDGDEAGTSTFTTETSGTHQIRVDGGFDSTAGAYELTLDESDPFVLGDGSTPSAQGEIAGPDDEQFIDLEVRGGAEVTVDVTTTDPAFDIVVILRDPEDDTELDRFDSAGPGEGESIDFTPSVDRTWRIAVQGKDGSTGTFQVDAYE